MQRFSRWLCVLASMFVMVSTAMTQDKLPDLMPVLIDADKGLVEVRNIGDAVAKPSRVFVVCTWSPPQNSNHGESCAAGLHLPGFIEKWNTWPIDIPALKPGAKYPIHLFGAGAFQRRAGLTAMKIVTDPLRKIPESNESNNRERLEALVREEPSSASRHSGRAADLVPVIVNADRGIVRVKNNGAAVAKASRLIAECRVRRQRGGVDLCMTRTYLPNFNAGGVLFSSNIPALRPGESHEVHLFGPDAWPRRTGIYNLHVHVDFDKQVAEAIEGNNSTSFTSHFVDRQATPGSKPETSEPDLIAVASDPFFGIFYVENKGGAKVAASKLVMTCTQGKQNGGCPTNYRMERLYDAKLGGFVKNVPPIPAGKVQRVIFPMSGLAWEKKAYTFNLTVDAGHAVTEIRENNNTLRKTLRWETGILRIVSSGHDKSSLINYGIYPSGDRNHTLWRNKSKTEGRKIQTPVEISLPVGVYKLYVSSGNGIGDVRWFSVTVKASKVVTQKVAFKKPGFLDFDIVDEHDEKLNRVAYMITTSGGKAIPGGGLVKSPPFHVSLLPGDYDLHVYRKLSRFEVSGTSTAEGGPVMGADEEQVIRGIHIQSDRTIRKHFVFKHIDPGILKVHVLADGKPNQAYVNVSTVAAGAPILFSFDSTKTLKLAPGRYRLTIRPKDESGGGTFQNAGYGLKRVEIVMHAGETVEKRVSFVKARKGSLVLTVLVNGSLSNAKTSVRKAGRKGRFITIDVSKTDLLPGRYDFSVWPVEHCFSPGGVDVFHGGVSGPRLRTRRLPDVKPVILHDVEIKPGERLKKTVEFNGVTRYTKVCM